MIDIERLKFDKLHGSSIVLVPDQNDCMWNGFGAGTGIAIKVNAHDFVRAQIGPAISHSFQLHCKRITILWLEIVTPVYVLSATHCSNIRSVN